MSSSTEKKKRVLVAEDDAPMARALSLKLTGAGFEVVCVTAGEQTLAALDKDKFDVLLLDLIMPGVDGFAVLKELKAKGSKLPVVVLTNLGQEEDRAKVNALGAVGYYVKSDTPLNKIVEIVGKI